MAEQRDGSWGAGEGGGQEMPGGRRGGRGVSVVGYFLIVQRFPNLIAFHKAEPLAKS